MLDIQRLEKRWKLYKFKSYLKHLIAFLVLCFLLVLIGLSLKTTNKIENEIVKPIKIDSKVVQKPKIKKLEPLKEKPIIVEEKLVITPSFEFLTKIENEKTVAKKIVLKNKSTQKEVLPKKEKPPTVTTEKRLINIKREDSYKNIADVIKRFKKNNNPALSLFVAKKYYELGEYNKSYNYALVTNNINNKIESSWLIFAKSLVKLNKKDKAVKILKDYIKTSHSNSAKILLEDIEKGRLR